MTDLISRLSEAEVGSRELDAEIWKTLDITRYRRWARDALPLRPRCKDAADYLAERVVKYAPPYTTSIDRALALVAEKLPGWTTDVHTADSSPETYPIRRDLIGFDDGSWEVTLSYCHPKIDPREIGAGYAPTAPLAILIALLNALRALQQGGGA